MARMQTLVDIPTWIGAYEKAMSEAPDEARAIALADQAVIDSQGSGLLKDQSAIEAGGGMKKVMTMFYSYMNTVFNQAVVSGYTSKSRGKFAADMLLLVVAPAVVNRLIKDALLPTGNDDEDYWRKLPKRLAQEEASYLLGMMTITREFSSLVSGYGYSGPAGLRMVADAGTFVQQGAQLEFDTAFRRATVNILGDTMGIPSVQINRTWDGIEALINGKTENPLAPLTGYKDAIR